ncbi:hypothetical protein ACIHBQ_30900 [Streptomyces sp. NPDC052492]|uniref:hypothetical protein n=1 Tax=unclassified Streptomyces TaxID=2593676 RepID=UPI0037CFAD57
MKLLSGKSGRNDSEFRPPAVFDRGPGAFLNACLSRPSLEHGGELLNAAHTAQQYRRKPAAFHFSSAWNARRASPAAERTPT